MSCSSATAPSQSDPIDIAEVTVNDITISAEEIAREVQYHPANSPQEGIQAATEALIIQSLLQQKSKQLGLWIDNRTEEENISDLLEQQTDVPQATEDDCERYFAANREKFYSSPLIEASHILISADPEDTPKRDAAKQLSERLITSLQDTPKKFGELARQYSACPSKETNGNLGQLSKGQTTPEFERQVFPLAQGLSKHPVETRYGYHVVLVERKIDGEPLEYDHVKGNVAEYLNEASQRKAISQYLQILLSEASIKGIDLDLEQSPLIQ